MWDGEGLHSPAGAKEAVLYNEERLQRVLQRANALCEPRDGKARLDAETRRTETAALLLLVDGIPSNTDSRKARALRSFVRGKVLDDGEAYVMEAEKELSRAVKLDPTLGGAWNQLGTCMWKKGDVQLAHDCWQNTLVHCSDGEYTKEAMRKLSMAFRSGKGNNPEESLRLAKELISKDMADTQSWTNLGNAYMSYFFASSLDREDLFRALKAYHRYACQKIPFISTEEPCDTRNRDPLKHAHPTGPTLMDRARTQTCISSKVRSTDISKIIRTR